MEAVDLERKAARRAAFRNQGIPTEVVRGFAGQVQVAGLEAEIMALPFDDGASQALQDPSSGVPYFMVGISAVGGADPIGGA